MYNELVWLRIVPIFLLLKVAESVLTSVEYVL